MRNEKGERRNEKGKRLVSKRSVINNPDFNAFQQKNQNFSD